ncbi:ornithine carbamoyltransferase [Gloeothece citriformis PCC 7424]|uniref:Ornithine carbamoyltransferase, catabolic n=1 Tax=Gloeothece citriformis (strain PCC 7424) TaxID=65393 RepID=B7KKU6_GLOC7|nr:ornithine carbamoyltransferase [Gloeothece citriformis]ACK71065.1 ornithine carbamoyltransferase [Gloeothece citriformis PCC 7424]
MSLKTLQGKDILSIADLSPSQILDLLQLATELKKGDKKPVCNKILGLLFYKASTRTRVSFTTAMYQLGGQVIDLNPSVTQVGRGEPISDTARVLDRYLDLLAIRTFKQEDLQTFADYADIPIINALSDLEHPCQILADLLTIQENFGTLSGITLSYLGDGNNVAHSLLLGGALMGMKIRIATPNHYKPNSDMIEKAKEFASSNGGDVLWTEDPIEATAQTQVLYTDVWASMGQEDSADSRIPVFQPYQLNEALLTHAHKEAIVLHCLPAHRGEEITQGVIEGKQSRVWDQAENRMHAQKALMVSVLGLE